MFVFQERKIGVLVPSVHTSDVNKVHSKRFFLNFQKIRFWVSSAKHTCVRCDNGTTYWRKNTSGEICVNFFFFEIFELQCTIINSWLYVHKQVRNVAERIALKDVYLLSAFSTKLAEACWTDSSSSLAEDLVAG